MNFGCESPTLLVVSLWLPARTKMTCDHGALRRGAIVSQKTNPSQDGFGPNVVGTAGTRRWSVDFSMFNPARNWLVAKIT